VKQTSYGPFLIVVDVLGSGNWSFQVLLNGTAQILHRGVVEGPCNKDTAVRAAQDQTTSWLKAQVFPARPQITSFDELPEVMSI
jgi:hypothetical protein